MELMDQIRIAREAAGLSQTELGGRLGISKQSIIWWEKGEHRPKMERIRALEEVLHVRLDLSERGLAKPMDCNGRVPSLAADPEMHRLAVAIGMLPQDYREAIITLIKAGQERALGGMMEVRTSNTQSDF